jgi:hypothetical protein
MDRPEAVRLLILWVAALAFLQTADGPTTAVVTVASWVGVAVVNLVPLFILGGLAEWSGISIWPDYDADSVPATTDCLPPRFSRMPPNARV